MFDQGGHRCDACLTMQSTSGPQTRGETMKPFIMFSIILLFLSSSLCAHDLAEPSPVDDDALEGLDIYMGVVTSFYCALLTTYNVVRFHSGHPTRVGGVVGTLSGLLQTAFGIAIIYSEDGNDRVGVGCTGVGLVTTYYGIRNILGVRREHLEEQEKGLTFAPLIRPDSRGSSFCGITIEYSF